VRQLPGFNQVRRPLSLKITFLSVFTAITIVVALSFYHYRRSYDDLERDLGKNLLHIAKTAALGIDAVDHAEIHAPTHHAKPEFTRLRDYLRKVMKANEAFC